MQNKYNKIFLWLTLSIVTVLFFSAVSTSIAWENVTLAWDANTEPDLEGYYLYRKEGSPGPPYDLVDTYPEDELDNPLNPEVVVDDLAWNTTYSFVVTAYDTEGNESDVSNAISVLNGKLLNTVSASDSGGGGGGGGGGGSGCFIDTLAF
jgi:hypothetical protein